MTEVEQPPQNGIDLSANEDDDNSKARPADIEQDMREMERRKRVEAIMGSKLFREELERIVDSARDSGNADGILQQLSDIVGVPATRVGSVFKASNCMQPINDIRGVESMGYAKGEKILRCKLAATFRLLDLYGWTQGLGAQITARLKVDQEYFLVNPYGLLYHEITASSLNKVDMQGNIVEQGTTNFGVNKSHFVLHSVVHAARPDIRCAIYIGCSPVVAISSLKTGLLPLTKDACVLGDITTFSYAGSLYDQDERDKLVRNLGPNSKVMLLTNHGALCCGETIEEAFFAACHIVQACETQLKLLPVGLDNLVLISEESRKTIYEQSRRPPEDLAKKFAAANVNEEEDKKEAGAETTKVLGQPPKWRVGGAEFEALMRMLDNAGYRTGYIYRHPLIKTEPPKPKNDVELPPAVSSLGYLLEEEELFRQGIWKKGAMGKGGDRSRWLNSPNVYQKVEVLETGTPDPKKITKWVAEGSPTHSTPVRIDDPLQFVPVNTNPKEFKRLQQQIKENRRADKISAGPQSHILEGVTWDEANRIKDATVSQAGDHVVLMGAASKGIIQRGFQHNATVYKAPYAKNPFDNVTDDELNEYKRTVERKKKSIHGEYTDTDFSESEALSSLQTSGAQQQTKQNTTTTTTTAAVSQSEPEDISEHRVMRIETQQAPVPSQPEVVLSDDYNHHRSTNIDINYHNSSSIFQLIQKNIPYHHLSNQLHSYTYLQNILAKHVYVKKLQTLAEKYKFLYEQSWWPTTTTRTNDRDNDSVHKSTINLYMIHKIEIYPHYTYPTPNLTMNDLLTCHNAQDQKEILATHDDLILSDTNSSGKALMTMDSSELYSLPPYRTVSHYGFNYPSTYKPLVHMHPACSVTSVDLQRQKVIAFIKRLNMEAQAAGPDSHHHHSDSSTSKLNKLKRGKEDHDHQQHIYENTKKLESTESFISVKEIHLNNLRKDRKISTSSSNQTKSNMDQQEQHHHAHNHGDLMSEQFSSLLSISGTYPAATHSHTGDQDHYHFNTDSADNCSNCEGQSSHKTTPSENLYHRNYVGRNFVNNTDTDNFTDHDPHKPECEQKSPVKQKIIYSSTQSLRSNDNRHVTLTLNSLKRRASSLSTDPKEKPRSRSKSYQQISTNATIQSPKAKEDDGQSQSESSSTATAIEIHINVNIRNSDCIKNLQNHEQEFKWKLEKVIDNEITLITRELENQANEEEGPIEIEDSSLPTFLLEPSQRCLSAPDAIGLYDHHHNSAYTEADRQYSYEDHIHSTASTPLPQATYMQQDNKNLHNLRYRHTLALLEHELEMLINGIIRNMCDCKAKISQISDEIRTATLHVGSLNTGHVKDKKRKRQISSNEWTQ
ncbi:adducin 1-like protein hts isoform X1 [Haematobia irritans]|uniref:adducin 1-like protein hts isoform X1 n=1 Tax=Haematobia irritans TaxID=7368 RepID=UPI003F4FCEFC